MNALRESLDDDLATARVRKDGNVDSAAASSRSESGIRLSLVYSKIGKFVEEEKMNAPWAARKVWRLGLCLVSGES